MRTVVKILAVCLWISLIVILTGAAAGSAVPTSTGPESITLDQEQPVSWGETLTFTAVFTGTEKKDWPPRIYNPVVALECGTYRGASFWSGGKHDDNLGGGWWTSTYPLIPQGSGAANCIAWLESTDSAGNTTILASTQFLIS